MKKLTYILAFFFLAEFHVQIKTRAGLMAF